MKYQSEIIKEIIDRRGHTMSSPHYESECIESWINENKGSYPKLTDYQSEWLNYIEENPNGIFPYVTLSDVTDATIDNVVPYAYKSAILKGNTMVNATKYISDANSYGLTNHAKLFSSDMLTPNTKYLCIWDAPSYISHIRLYTLGSNTSKYFDITNQKSKKFIITSKESFDGDGSFCPHWYTSGDDVVSKDDLNKFSLMLIPYQDGMENWNIPYFEGMQSVKMPVLTTIGKNLVDTTSMWFDGYASNSSEIKKSNSTKSLICKVKPNTTYTFTRTQVTNRCVISSFKGNHEDLPTTKQLYSDNDSYTEKSVKFTTLDDTEYVIIYVHHEPTTPNGWVEHGIYQLEEGSIATSFESYKSNILSTSEDVVLRGVGDVQDTLDLMTGEVSQNLIEFEFNEGDYFASTFTEFENTLRWQTTLSTRQLLKLKGSGKIYSTNFISDNSNNDFEHIRIDSSRPYANVIIYLSKTKASTYEELKTYLKNNPFTIIAEKAEKSIKTVDLIITNQDDESLIEFKPIEGTMTLKTSSDTIQPLFSGEIPVEAITQNLASFIEG